MMAAMRCVRATSLCLLGAAVLAGCGGKKDASSGATATEAALGFAKALQSGSAEKAAAYWAYDHEARQQNEDWGSIPPGQRNQIIDKVRAERVTTLAPLATAMKAATGDLTASEQSGSVAVSAGGKVVLSVTCVQSGSEWKVADAKLAGG